MKCLGRKPLGFEMWCTKNINKAVLLYIKPEFLVKNTFLPNKSLRHLTLGSSYVSCASHAREGEREGEEKGEKSGRRGGRQQTLTR